MISTSLSQARQYHEQGDQDAAREACLVALREEERNFEALHLLGLVELQVERAEEAATQLERAADVDGSQVDVWNHLAIAYSRLSRHNEAVAAFERAASIDKENPHVHFNLALAYSQLERVDEAVAGLRRAIELQPELAEAHLKLGKLLYKRGDLQGAVQSLRVAAALRPDQESAQKALAKCLEQMNGGGKTPPTVRFGRELLRLADERSDGNAGVTPAGDERLFFVFGTPKSGTTWVQLLLDAHPQVACRPEDQFALMFDGASQLVRGYNNLLADVDHRTARQGANTLDDVDAAFACASLIRRILGRRLGEPSVLRSGAKDNGIMELFEGLFRQFSAARFVHVVRDPRDIAVSSWFHNLRVEQNFKARAGTLEQWAGGIARRWNRETISVIESAFSLGVRVLTVRYEDLHAEAEKTLQELIAWLDVDDDLDIVRQCMEACSFDSLSGGRERGTEDRGSFFRRGVAGDWRNHLEGRAASQFLSLAGEAMSRFGYR